MAALRPEPAGAQTAQTVPVNWGLIPQGINPGDSFRLLFLTSNARNPQSANTADYNSFVQERANNGHNAICSFSNAKANTATTSTGVPIYWLNGLQVADDYDDFYDGFWDSRAGKNESGNNRSTTSIWTGCLDNGNSHNSQRLGANSVRFGELTTGSSPLSSGSRPAGSNHPFYALSPVLTVVTPPAAPAAPTVVPTSGSETTSLDVTWTAPADNGSAITDYDIQPPEPEGAGPPGWLLPGGGRPGPDDPDGGLRPPPDRPGNPPGPEGYSLQLRAELAGLVQRLTPLDLGAATLRTLATIALKQPIRQAALVEFAGLGSLRPREATHGPGLCGPAPGTGRPLLHAHPHGKVPPHLRPQACTPQPRRLPWWVTSEHLVALLHLGL